MIDKSILREAVYLLAERTLALRRREEFASLREVDAEVEEKLKAEENENEQILEPH
jgi:hypothetical protein